MQSTRSGIDDIFTDIPFSAALGRKGTVGKYHTDASLGRKVPDHVLEPGKVGVPGRRCAVLPAHIVQQLVLPPSQTS